MKNYVWIFCSCCAVVSVFVGTLICQIGNWRYLLKIEMSSKLQMRKESVSHPLDCKIKLTNWLENIKMEEVLWGEAICLLLWLSKPYLYILFRPSGTEDIVRVYAEANTQGNADALGKVWKIRTRHLSYKIKFVYTIYRK